jgi:hypothetical protein
MRVLTAAVIVCVAFAAPAVGKTKSPRRAPVSRSASPAPKSDTNADRPAATDEAKAESKPAAKSPKAKVYTFTGLDVEGKLKTPQLLYFLNRVKLELDTTGREKRSFLKELEQSSDDKGL